MITAQPYRRPCAVLCHTEHERPCGKPSGDHTVLDQPICDSCYEAVAAIPSDIIDPRRLLADGLGLTGEQVAYQIAS